MYVNNWSIEDICEFAISHIAKGPGNKVIIFGVDFTADAKLIVKKKSHNEDYKKIWAVQVEGSNCGKRKGTGL